MARVVSRSLAGWAPPSAIEVVSAGFFWKEGILMAKFLNTSATNYFLEELIKDAKD